MEKLYSFIDNLLKINWEKTSFYLTILAIFINIIIVLWLFFKYQKKKVIKDINKDIKDFPSQDNPELIELIFKKEITHISLISVILNLIYKGKLILEKEYLPFKDKNEYLLKLSGKESINLTESEENLIHLLFGSNTFISLSEIKESFKNQDNQKEIIKKYYKWLNFVNLKYPQESLYENMKIPLNFVYLFVCLEASLFLIYIPYSTFAFVLPLMITALIIYISKISRYIYEISFKKKQWQYFNNYIKTFNKLNLNQLPSKEYWIKYLAYSLVLDSYNECYNAFINQKPQNTNLSQDDIYAIYDTISDYNQIIKDFNFNLKFLTKKYAQKNITNL